MDIPQKGNLGNLDFSEVLSSLHQKKATGTIVIKGADFTKKVYLKNGEVAYASSSLEEERLGEMLIKAGMITREQYDISVDVLKRTGKKQGSILVELGILTPKQLFEGLKFQINEIIYSIFLLGEAEYEFKDGDLCENEIIGLRIRINELIEEGMKRVRERDTSEKEETELKKKAREFYSRLKDMTAADILQITEESSIEEIKKNYYRLAREYHPDRAFNSRDSELKEMLTDIFDAIAKAYDELKDEERRREFFREIVRPQKEQPQIDLTEQFKRGMLELKKRNYWGAAEIFRWITRIDSKSVRAWHYLSLSLSNIPGKLKDAELALLEAIKLEPFSSDHYANLGNIYLKAGLKKRAKRQFDRALSLDSSNEKALKGLEELKGMMDD